MLVYWCHRPHNGNLSTKRHMVIRCPARSVSAHGLLLGSQPSLVQGAGASTINVRSRYRDRLREAAEPVERACDESLTFHPKVSSERALVPTRTYCTAKRKLAPTAS